MCLTSYVERYTVRVLSRNLFGGKLSTKPEANFRDPLLVLDLSESLLDIYKISGRKSDSFEGGELASSPR